MVLTTFVLATLAAAGPVKLAAPGFNAVDVDQKRADFFVDYFADQLTSQGGVRVTTKSEIAALLGMERQKPLMGCGDESAACLAELAGALGVDALIIGNVVKVERGFAVTAKIVRARNGEPIASASGRFDKEGKLLDWLREIAPGFVQRTRDAFGPASGSTTGPTQTTSATTPAATSAPQLAAPAQQTGASVQDPPRNRFILGAFTLGYERWLGDHLALGLHGHILAGPRFLFWPAFAVGAYGWPYLRWKPLSIGPVDLSLMATLGYGVTQDYTGPTGTNVIVAGYLLAPAIEVAFYRFGIAFEVPWHFIRTYPSGELPAFTQPVFVRLTYAFAF